MEQEDSEKGAENPPEVSSQPESSEKDDIKKDAENPPKGSSKPELSDKNTSLLLKAKPKIAKKSQAGKFKTIKNKGAQLILGKQRKRKNKKEVGDAESCRNGEGYADKQISENSQQEKTTDEQPNEKSQQTEKNKQKESQKKSTSDKLAIKNSRQAKRNKKIIELDKRDQKQKNKEKHGEANKGASSRTNKDQRADMEKNQSSKKRREKLGGMEKSQSSEKKKEKLGGLIFMCNAKTKPDCFHYRVMGVSAGKKDVVLGVKPGLKLFLYDFDFKLLYGIYKASSSGGMKLEPRAFSGSFPAQVRFNIVKDCFPLPESIFKKAIKENYNERHKFKTELTVGQVRKLTELFRPVEIHSALLPTRSPPKSIICDREAPDGVRGSWPHSHRERPRDPYTHSHVNSYNVLSHDRDHRNEQREEIPCDLFLNEKDYRAYGLQGDRRNVTPPSHVNPILEPDKRDYEREHFHLPYPTYRDNVPAHAESLRSDPHPLYLNQSDHQVYVHGAIRDYTKEPYHAYRYGASPRDPYLPPLSREEISSSSFLVGGRTLIGTDDLQRRETVQDRHYTTYAAADALSDYNRMQHYHGDKPEATPLPVSSRYSFAGPSYTYR